MCKEEEREAVGKRGKEEEKSFPVSIKMDLGFIKSARKPQAFELGDEWLPGAKRRPFMGFYLKPQPLGWGVVHFFLRSPNFSLFTSFFICAYSCLFVAK